MASKFGFLENMITKGQWKGHMSYRQCGFFSPILLSTFGGSFKCSRLLEDR